MTEAVTVALIISVPATVTAISPALIESPILASMLATTPSNGAMTEKDATLAWAASNFASSTASCSLSMPSCMRS